MCKSVTRGGSRHDTDGYLSETMASAAMDGIAVLTCRPPTTILNGPDLRRNSFGFVISR
jgi:hypothetical protein